MPLKCVDSIAEEIGHNQSIKVYGGIYMYGKRQGLEVDSSLYISAENRAHYAMV